MIFSNSYDFIIHIPIFNVWCTYLRQMNQKELYCEIGKHVKFKKRQCSLSSKKQSSPTYRTVFTEVKKTVKTQSLESRHWSILSNFTIVNSILTLVNKRNNWGYWNLICCKGNYSCAISHTRLGVNIAKFWFLFLWKILARRPTFIYKILQKLFNALYFSKNVTNFCWLYYKIW